MKTKYTHKTLREKCQALKDLEKEENDKDLAAKYNVPENTLSAWVKNRKTWCTKKGTNVYKRQKLKSGNHELVDQKMQSQNVPLSTSMMQEKAVIFAKELNTRNFQASGGWLRRWKERNNISFKTVSGASKSVTPEMINAWSETSLPTLMSSYDLKDIYNVDDFGLFISAFQIKLFSWSQKSAMGKS